LENTSFKFLFYGNTLLDKIHHPNLNPDSAELVKCHAVQLQFNGTLQTHAVKSQSLQPFYHNYFNGKDPKKWAAQVPVCKSVLYKNLYAGIDVVVFGSSTNVRYDFNVNPGADPATIKMSFTGQDQLALREGKLIIYTSVGEIEQKPPYAFQKDKKGNTIPVACNYVL